MAFKFQDDSDCISNSGRPSGGPASLYGAGSLVGQGTTSLLENLQSNLKQRDGENHQLHWELSRLNAERNVLMSEVSSLTLQLENVSFIMVLIIFFINLNFFHFRSKNN